MYMYVCVSHTIDAQSAYQLYGGDQKAEITADVLAEVSGKVPSPIMARIWKVCCCHMIMGSLITTWLTFTMCVEYNEYVYRGRT